MSNNLSLNSNKNNSLNKNFNRNNSNNYNRRNSGGSNKKTLMVLAIGFVIILLVFAIVMIIIHVKTKVKGGGPDHREKILQKLIHDCNNDPLLVRHVPASSDFNEYSLSFWLYVKNTDATIIGQEKKREIITKGKVIGGIIEDTTKNELDIYMDEGESTLKLFFGFDEAEGSIQDLGCINVNDYLSKKINEFWQKPLPTPPTPPPPLILGAAGATGAAEENLFFTIHKEFEMSFDLIINTTIASTTRDEISFISNSSTSDFVKGGIPFSFNYYKVSTPTTKGTISFRTELTETNSNNNGFFYSNTGNIDIVEVIDPLNPKLEINKTYNLKVIFSAKGDEVKLNITGHHIAEFIQSTQLNNRKEFNDVKIVMRNNGNSTISNFKYIKLSSSEQAERITQPIDIISSTSSVDPNYKTFDECKKGTNESKNYFGMVDYKYYKDTSTNKETAVSRCIKLNNDIKDNITSTSKLSLCKGISDGLDRNKTGPVNMGSQEYMYVSSTSSNQSQKPCELKLMPLERWNHITINVHGNICDLFFDGKLYRTCVLSAPPILKNNPIIIGNKGGFNGYVSNVVWSNKALHPGDIHQRYLRGPRLRLTFRERLTYFFSPNKKSKILQEHESEQEQLEEEQKSQSRV